MASLTDFLSNLSGSSGSFFSGSMFYTEPDAAPRAEKGPQHDTEHLSAVSLPVQHTCLPVTANHLGTSCWCPDPPPPFPVHFLFPFRTLWVQSSLLWPLNHLLLVILPTNTYWAPTVCQALHQSLSTQYWTNETGSCPRGVCILGGERDKSKAKMKQDKVATSIRAMKGQRQKAPGVGTTYWELCVRESCGPWTAPLASPLNLWEMQILTLHPSLCLTSLPGDPRLTRAWEPPTGLHVHDEGGSHVKVCWKAHSRQRVEKAESSLAH